MGSTPASSLICGMRLESCSSDKRLLFRGLSRDSLEGCSRPPRIPSQVEDQADRGDVQGMGLLLALHVGHVCQEARQGLVGVLEERLSLVEGIDLSHLLVRQREVEEVDVLSDV